MANDTLQKFREAIVAVLDAHGGIAAITGRGADNVVAWGGLGAVPDSYRKTGLIAYQVIVGSEPAADGKPESFVVQFGAVAAEESITNELIGVVKTIDAPAFLALVPPIDAHATNRVRRPMPFDSEEELARSDIDITYRVHF